MRFFSLVLVSIFLFSCNQEIKTDKKVFKFNLATGLGNLDPVFAKDMSPIWVCGNIYDCLFTLNENTELENQLVESYSINKDASEYTFVLKKNVFFHKNTCFKNKEQTRIMTSHDMVYSLKRLVNPKVASPGAWILRDHLDSIHAFQIIDSFTFKVKLRHPFAQFINVLTMPYCSVVPKEAIDYYGRDFRKNPVGTGPFQLKVWEDGTALILEKNPRYFQKDSQGNRLPYLDIVKISFNEQKKTEFLSFQKGELDFITGIDASYINELFNENGILKAPFDVKYQLIKCTYLNTEYMAILQKEDLLPRNSPLKNIQIRKAIQHAINKKEIVQYLKNNLVTPATKGFVALGMPNYDTTFRGFEYNPKLSKEYIKNAGYTAINKPKIELHINNTYVDMAEFIIYQLEKVGFEIDLKLHPAEMMMQLASEGKIEFFRRSWTADYPDAESFFACFYSKNGAPPNYTRFSNSEYDILYEKILSEPKLELRKKYYYRMEEIIRDLSPVIPIFYDQSIRLVQKNIVGITQNPLNNLDLRRTNKIK